MTVRSREQDIVPVWRVRRVNLGAEKRGGGGEVMASIRGHFLEIHLIVQELNNTILGRGGVAA
jgi:hypothetical protein